jgi:hypothetical protein
MKNKQEYLNVFKNYKRLASNLISNISSYDSWSSDFSVKEIKALYSKLIREFQDIDFLQFTSDELKELDFSMWDENIILMPVWAIDCLPDGCIVTSISGDERVFDKKKGLDKDERFGSTAYGFTISQLRDTKLDNILQ